MGWIPHHWFYLLTWFCIGANLGLAAYTRRHTSQQQQRMMTMAKGAFGAGFDRGYEVGVEAAMKGINQALREANLNGRIAVARMVPPDDIDDRPSHRVQPKFDA